MGEFALQRRVRIDARANCTHTLRQMETNPGSATA